MKKIFCSVLPAALACLSACSPAGNGVPGGGAAAETARDTLVVSVASDPATFDLLYANTLIEGQIGNNIYEGLLFHDEEGRPGPWLAESYEISDDGLDYTFHLRRGAKFHNGEEFKARDVEFTIGYARGTPYGSAVTSLIKAVTVTGDYTVKLTLSEPITSFLSEFASDQFAIYNEKAVKSVEKYGEHPVGTGPYRFAGRKPGEEVRLEAFPDYYGPPPPIKNVVFRIIPDDFTAAVALETGDIDLIWIASAASAVALESKEGVTVFSSPSNRVNYLSMNVEKKPFDNVKLRQAVNYAIDRDTIAAVAYEGRSADKDYMAMPWMSGFAEPARRYPHDPARAALLAKEAGAGRENPVNVTLITTGANRRVAEIVQQNLADIGISLSIEIMEFNTWVTQYYAGDFQIAAGGHYIMFKDMNYLSYFYGTENIGQGNSARYSNPAADRLLAEGRREADPEKRRAVFKQFVDITQEDAPYAVFAGPEIIRAHNSDLVIARNFPNGIYLKDISWK
ncbi:MAG: ABC transporter substrate-binding protein [Treponema sp.]|jgi:peptide/nickel transport system substrate-binding protein|nr:ABC transporter substrate-binding protein [Treponema sp.]